MNVTWAFLTETSRLAVSVTEGGMIRTVEREGNVVISRSKKNTSLLVELERQHPPATIVPVVRSRTVDRQCAVRVSFILMSCTSRVKHC